MAFDIKSGSGKVKPDREHAHIQHSPLNPYHVHDPCGITLVIPGELPPGLNKLIRTNRWEYRRLKRDWHYLVLAALGSHRPCYDRAHIKMTAYRLGRMDKDNEQGSFKIVGDVLRDLKIIKDDNPDCITTTITSVRLKPRERDQIRTVIKISTGEEDE